MFSYIKPYLFYNHWKDIRHGFTDISFDFARERGLEGLDALKVDLKVSDVLLDIQVHGVDIVDLRVNESLDQILSRDRSLFDGRTGIEADAFIVDSKIKLSNGPIVVGVSAADCIPLIIRSGTQFALVHAGWRGLASGIVQRAIRMLPDHEIEVVIGPCAGADDYQVGTEVIEAFAGKAISKQSTESGKLILDLVATAKVLIAEVCNSAKVYSCNISTITDKRFHSHRRDAALSGRGMGFLVVGE